MGLKLQVHTPNIMPVKPTWGAPRPHNHSPSYTQTGPLGDFPDSNRFLLKPPIRNPPCKKRPCQNCVDRNDASMHRKASSKQNIIAVFYPCFSASGMCSCVSLLHPPSTTLNHLLLYLR